MTTEVTASATAAAGDIVAPGVTLRPDEGGMARYSGSSSLSDLGFTRK